MQRVRMSLPYLQDFGWEAEVVTVDIRFTDVVRDDLLIKSVPSNTVIHTVQALSKTWTSKVGLGSIALRSLFYYKKKVNQLLKLKHYDLIYFSTTQFPVCILGAYWKRRFKIPYVIDMQDPWHTEYYNDKPKNERPPKYWAAYRINKMLEPIAMKNVSGLISVSKAYLEVLAQRYKNCRHIPSSTITFGAFQLDFAIAQENKLHFPSVLPSGKSKIRIVYVGRGGKDMTHTVRYMLSGFKQGLKENAESFSRLHFYFIGTSYAAAGKGEATIVPVANDLGIKDFVTEITDRISFYETLNTLADADALFVPGSVDAQYTASKIYPYVLAKKPMLAIFHPLSSVVTFLRSANAGTVATIDEGEEQIVTKAKCFLKDLLRGTHQSSVLNESVIQKYSARTMTKIQCDLFDKVLSANSSGMQA